MSAEAQDKGLRCRRVAHFFAAYHVEVDVAGLAVRASWLDVVEPIRHGARGPGARSRRPNSVTEPQPQVTLVSDGN